MKFNALVEDPDYLYSLNYKNIKVMNFSPTNKKEINLDTFLLDYRERQQGIVLRIDSLSRYLSKRKLYSLKDIRKHDREFLKSFVGDMDIFLASNYYTTIKVKLVEEELYKKLSEKYPPEVHELLLLPSFENIYTFRMLKECEFVRGENEDFVDYFCGGNKILAKKVAKGSINEEQKLRITIKDNKNKKFYFMLERPDVGLLDRLLFIDNFVEPWIWKQSWFTAPMWHAYNLINELLFPTGKIPKSQYIFDINLMRESL